MRIPVGLAMPGILGPLALLGFLALLVSIPGQTPDSDSTPAGGRRGEPASLEVVFTLPIGAVLEVPTVDVLFNRPMRPVGKERRGDEADLLVLSPSVPGRIHWIGSRALRFVPQRPFPRATAFTATVPQGVKDATGSALPKASTWSFSTRPPAVNGTQPWPDFRHLEPASPIVVLFNQPIDVDRVARATRLTVDGTTVAFRCAHPDTSELAEILHGNPAAEMALIRPERPFPLATKVELAIDAVPLAVEGPLPMSEPFSATYRTYGPLALLATKASADGLILAFANPVSPETLAAHVRVTGEARVDTAAVTTYGDAPSTNIFLNVRLGPGLPLTVQLDATLRDTFGQQLGREEKRDLVTQDLPPDLQILPENGTLEALGPRRAAVRATNLRHVTVRTAALTADQAIALIRNPPGWDGTQRNPFSGTVPHQRTQRLEGPRNRPERINIDLDELLGGSQRRPTGGFVLVRASSPDRFANPATGLLDSLSDRFSVVQVTDLGLMAKATVSEVLVWATSLHTGEPLAGVDLQIVDDGGKKIWGARTDRDGLARGAAPAGWQQAGGWTLIGRRGRDATLLLMERDWQLRPWAFDLPADYAQSPRRADAFLFTDREIYRPGETVHVKGIVRAIGRPAVGPAPLDSVRLRVNDPRGDEILDRRLRLSDFGSFALDLPLPRDAGLGHYWGNLEPLGTAAPPVEVRGSLSFRLEAYRPAAFRVDLTLRSPERTPGPDEPLRLVRGDHLAAAIRARTFFDSPLAGSPVRLLIRRERSTFAPPGPAAKKLAGYSFSDYTLEETHGELVTTAVDSLDSGGEAQMVAETALPGIATPQALEVDVEVRDAGDRTVAAHRTADWFPAAVQIGLKAEPQVVGVGDPVEIAVVAAAVLTGAVESEVAVRLQWVRRTWHTVKRQMVGGRLGYDSEVVEAVVDSAIVTTHGDLESPAVARFVPDRPGEYVVRARAADAHGRETRSADFVYASGPGFVPWSRDTGNRLTLVADQSTYAPGDTATVLAQSPFPAARGLLTLEREGIHEVIPFEAQSTAPVFKIPLGEDAIPNLFASLVLVRGAAPGPGAAPDDTLWSGEPEVRMGYVNLQVLPDSRRLSVEIDAPDTAGPGDSVAVRVMVTRAQDRKAQAAEVTLMLVDEAVLRLLGTQTPDPFAFFYRPRGLGVVNAAKALHIVMVRDEAEKGREPGGGGGEGGRYRRLFATTALFSPELRTGPDGIAVARFRLPDNLTTFRAMAVASDRSERLGSGESPLTVTRPLVLEPILPRLARVGDRFEVGAVLANRTSKKLRVRTEFGAKGGAVAIAGKKEQKVTIEPGKSRRVRFTAEAQAAGEATIQLAARTDEKGGPGDAISLPLRVEDPVLALVDAHYGVLAGADSLLTLPIAPAADADPARSAVEIQASTTLLGGIEESLTYLLEYPYGCLEQQASRLIGLAVAKEVGDRLVLTEWDSGRIAAATDDVLAAMGQLQHFDGGYRLWPESNESNLYLSAYALLALLEARDAGGAGVDPERLRQLGAYLKREFDAKRREVTRGQKGEKGLVGDGRVNIVRPIVRQFTFADAMTAALFAREAQVSRSPLKEYFHPADLERLYTHRKDLSDDGLLLLAAALNVVHPTDTRVGELLTGRLNRVSLTGGRAFLAAEPGRFGGGETQTTALALQVLLAAWPDHELVTPIARWIATSRRRGHWGNTHATAHAVLALRDLARREGKPGEEPIPIQATLGSTVLLERGIGGKAGENARITWPLDRLPGLKPGGTSNLVLRRSAAADLPLYHAVRLESVRPARGLQAAEAGLTIERAFFAFDALKPRASGPPIVRAAPGDVVRVELTLVVPRAAEDLILDDPLPAGLEPLILNLATVSRSFERALEERQRLGAEEDDGEGRVPSYAETGGIFPADHTERRDDRVIASGSYVPAGIYRFEYLARAATPGRFGTPPAEAELMYDPEVRGRSAPATFEVTQEEK